MRQTVCLLVVAMIAGCTIGPNGAAPGPAQPAGPPIEIGGLIGLSPTEAEDRLGKPAFRRTDGSGLFWRYTTRTCHLHVYLYAAKEADEPARIRHVEARPLGNDPISADTCLDAVVNRREGGESG